MENSSRSHKSIGYLLKKYSGVLETAGIDNSMAEVRFLMWYVTGKDLGQLYTELDKELNDIEAMKLKKLVMKRATHYPLQYILGDTYFMDMRFLCRENVLIPRSDTENAVMCALDHAPEKTISVLDMCTGSGCIGISYYVNRYRDGYDDYVTMVDISDHAIELARDNAKLHNADVNIVKSNLFEELKDEAGEPLRRYDIIICNPPYIKTNDINYLMKDVRDYEPRLALDGTRDGLYFYRRVTEDALDFLKPGGYLIYEIGYDQYMDVFTIMRNAGFKRIKKMMDMDGNDRVVFGLMPG